MCEIYEFLCEGFFVADAIQYKMRTTCVLIEGSQVVLESLVLTEMKMHVFEDMIVAIWTLFNFYKSLARLYSYKKYLKGKVHYKGLHHKT